MQSYTIGCRQKIINHVSWYVSGQQDAIYQVHLSVWCWNPVNDAHLSARAVNKRHGVSFDHDLNISTRKECLKRTLGQTISACCSISDHVIYICILDEIVGASKRYSAYELNKGNSVLMLTSEDYGRPRANVHESKPGEPSLTGYQLQRNSLLLHCAANRLQNRD